MNDIVNACVLWLSTINWVNGCFKQNNSKSSRSKNKTLQKFCAYIPLVKKADVCKNAHFRVFVSCVVKMYIFFVLKHHIYIILFHLQVQYACDKWRMILKFRQDFITHRVPKRNYLSDILLYIFFHCTIYTANFSDNNIIGSHWRDTWRGVCT